MNELFTCSLNRFDLVYLVATSANASKSISRLAGTRRYQTWTAYLCAYLRERARKGMTIEIDSPSYAVTTLSAFCRIHELTDDPGLKQCAGDYLTLFWALWAAISAQNRWKGVIFRGEPDARIYPTTVNRTGESIYNGHRAGEPRSWRASVRVKF